MDREALVLRNNSMAAAFHAVPPKHYVRRALLQAVAGLPVPATRLKRKNRILLIRPDHLGDVLLATPAVHALRTAHPKAELHLLAGPWSAGVLASYPEIDLVLTLAFPGFSRHPKDHWRSPYQLALSAARCLRRIGYGSAVVLRPDHWWGAMVAYLAGIPERIGYDLPDTAPFLTQAVAHQPAHAVMQNLRLVEHWTGPISATDAVFRFPVDHVDRAYVDGYLQEWGIAPGRPIVCIHPGSGTWVKHWREENWAKAGDALSGQLSAAVVLTGGEHELQLAGRIAAQMQEPACIIAGETHMGQLGALFARAEVVLGPDSGPLHLAAAVGTPTVTLYGPADPVEFGPWGASDQHFALYTDIGCRPCRVLDWADDNPEYHPCVREITVAQVLDAARRAVAARRQSNHTAGF